MEGLTRRQGPWTIQHVPGEKNAYDRVIGRMTPWSVLVEHETTGWRIFQYERDPKAQIVAPSGILVDVVDVDEWAGPRPSPLTPTGDRLIVALRTWVSMHAEQYEEPLIDD